MVNLLVLNIRVDADHPTQGVTTLWLKALAGHFDHIYVITMHKGRLDLPENVSVFSIGGELGYSKIKKTLNFYKLLFSILKNNRIQGCFTHMASYLIFMGGPILVFKRIPRITWYAHSVINPVMMGAFLYSNAIITASADSFRIKSRKVHITGHGIETEHYSRRATKLNDTFTIGSIGRISRIKNYETLLHALKLLLDEGINSFKVKLYGNIQTEDDKKYKIFLENLVREYGLEKKVNFCNPVSGNQVPEILSGFDIFVNILSRGGAGKAVLEAMSTEVPTLICTSAFNQFLSYEDRKLLVFRPNDSNDLKFKIKNMMLLPKEKNVQIGKRLRNLVLQEHSLKNLSIKISNLFKSIN